MIKKILSLIISAILIFTFADCGNNSANAGSSGKEATSDTNTGNAASTKNSKSLVVYFSWSGNTRAIAKEISKQTGADIFEIVPVKAYSDDYNTVVDEAKVEQRNNARPEIKGTADNFDDYDVVYFGFPNWWQDMPMIMYTFLDNYDFSGKTICEFVSSQSSGLSDTINSLKKAEPKATVTEGLSITGATSKGAASKVSDWLSEIGQK